MHFYKSLDIKKIVGNVIDMALRKRHLAEPERGMFRLNAVKLFVRRKIYKNIFVDNKHELRCTIRWYYGMELGI